MINSKEDYYEYLVADMRALGIVGNRPKYGGLRYSIWKYEVLMRKLEYVTNCKKSPVYTLYRLILKYEFTRQSIKYGFMIPINTFGKGLSIAHIGPIVVNGDAKIGENCRIHVDVNIGTQAGFGGLAPTIGNNVYIGPGAKLFGKIIIGDNIAIGANSVVNKSFLEEGITIAGIPAKKISNKGSYQLIANN